MHIRTSISDLPSNLANVSISSLLTSCAPNEKLKKEDYPDVCFWTRSDWSESSDSEDASEELGRGMRFLEDENGCVINSVRASLVRDQAHSIWNQIGASNPNLLPTTWGQAGLDLRQLFNKQMRTEFKEFQFCEADWKAKAFATEYYPNWYRKYSSKVKSEGSGALLDTTRAKSHKRSSTSKSDVTRKKTRLSIPSGRSTSILGDSSDGSSDILAHSIPSDPVATNLGFSNSRIAKGKQRADFNVPDPL